MKGLKRILKERKEYEKKLEEEKKKKLEIKKGIIEDKDLLEDFNLLNTQIPLRNLTHSVNPISERWNNIIKRNVIGIYSRDQKKKNRKLNKIKYFDKNNRVVIGLEEDLDVIE